MLKRIEEGVMEQNNMRAARAQRGNLISFSLSLTLIHLLLFLEPNNRNGSGTLFPSLLFTPITVQLARVQYLRRRDCKTSAAGCLKREEAKMREIIEEATHYIASSLTCVHCTVYAYYCKTAQLPLSLSLFCLVYVWLDERRRDSASNWRLWLLLVLAVETRGYWISTADTATASAVSTLATAAEAAVSITFAVFVFSLFHSTRLLMDEPLSTPHPTAASSQNVEIGLLVAYCPII